MSDWDEEVWEKLWIPVPESVNPESVNPESVNPESADPESVDDLGPPIESVEPPVEVEESLEGCSCLECRAHRAKAKAETELAKGFGEISVEKGHDYLKSFGQGDLSPREEIDRLCLCWYPKMLGLSEDLKIEVHELISMVAAGNPTQSQEIPDDEKLEVEITELTADFQKLLGKFRKSS